MLGINQSTSDIARYWAIRFAVSSELLAFHDSEATSRGDVDKFPEPSLSCRAIVYILEVTLFSQHGVRTIEFFFLLQPGNLQLSGIGHFGGRT